MKRPDSHPLYGAPELIIVSVKFDPSTEAAGHANAAMIDHNMALAATELGVGCVYIYGAIAAIWMKPAGTLIIYRTPAGCIDFQHKPYFSLNALNFSGR
ncbi:MAG: hypothetical protein LUD12_16110 [Lachnospiraceae bacterium]|nr:hypothetical protein [Lachnospiraceae bacterium]